MISKSAAAVTPVSPLCEERTDSSAFSFLRHLDGDQGSQPYDDVGGEPGRESTGQHLLALVQRRAHDPLSALLRVANTELRRRLNSTNFSKPPSADGLDRPPPMSMRARGGRSMESTPVEANEHHY